MVDLRWAGLNHDYDRVSTCTSSVAGIMVVTLPSCYTLSPLCFARSAVPLCAMSQGLSDQRLCVHLCSMCLPSQSRWSQLWEAMCGAQTTTGALGAGLMSLSRCRVSCRCITSGFRKLADASYDGLMYHSRCLSCSMSPCSPGGCAVSLMIA